MMNLELARNGDGAASQRLFESMFKDHEPKIDNRTPEAVNAGMSVHDFNEYRKGIQSESSLLH